ncbi:MAG: twin-arginine translocation signal domain-containing protein [bacterium]|nr:twin-arginine translocation signal domain-containing protein [bacterium]
MTDHLDRRSFLKNSIAVSGAAAGLGAEEQILMAQLAADEAKAGAAADTAEALPKGKIGDLEISRVICGGNLIGGWAHSRDLIYVSKLFKNYNTDDKIMETLEICEQNGVNAILTNPVSGPVINRYWRERKGDIQWICEAHPRSKDPTFGIRENIDLGASLIYIQGAVGDRLVRGGNVDTIAETLEFIRMNGLPAGVGAHDLDVVVACEEAGIKPDFYVKTLHGTDYWSNRKEGQPDEVIANRADNFWCVDPEQTIEVMAKIDKPWIAFKVLAAGAIHPKKGFKYAFDNGADFICVGMFDFQVAEDARTARDIIASADRTRPWRA